MDTDFLQLAALAVNAARTPDTASLLAREALVRAGRAAGVPAPVAERIADELMRLAAEMLAAEIQAPGFVVVSVPVE